MSENALQVFEYKEHVVRTTEIDGEIWFVAKDVCDILEIQNAARVAQDELDEDERGIRNMYTPGGMQDMTVISEAGLYKLAFKSRKDEAKNFTRWVTHEVLPSIRKTGSYSVKPNNDELKAKNRELDLKGAEILQHMLDTHTFPLTDESKAVIAHEMFKLITGTENRAMLPIVKEAMYSATEIGAKFGISENKVGKIANAHGLKPPIGETNDMVHGYVLSPRTRRTSVRSSCTTITLWTGLKDTLKYFHERSFLYGGTDN